MIDINDSAAICISILRFHNFISTTCYSKIREYFTFSYIWSIICGQVSHLSLVCLFFVFTDNRFSWSWTIHIYATTNCWHWRRVWPRQTLYSVWGNSVYIFNMAYKDSNAILSFLEQALMGISRGHILMSVNILFYDSSDL